MEKARGLSLVRALRQQDLLIGANIRRCLLRLSSSPELTMVAHPATLAFCALALILVPAMSKPWYQGGKRE